MRLKKVTDVLTNDRHFEEEDFRVLFRNFALSRGRLNPYISHKDEDWVAAALYCAAGC